MPEKYEPSPEHEWTKCSQPECLNKVKNHLWGHIKAENWLFLKTGEAYCPDHIPLWAEKWRKKNAR
jgi:hypothetical protein